MKKLFIILAAAMMAVGAMAAERGLMVGTWQGTIGPYKIHMVINQDVEKKGLIGYYYYDNHPKTHFKLKATKCEDSGAFCCGVVYDIILQEYTADGKNSGEFELGYDEHWINHVQPPYEEGLPLCCYDQMGIPEFITGTFRNKSNGKIFEVRLDLID
jgi:hypothetical protein